MVLAFALASTIGTAAEVTTIQTQEEAATVPTGPRADPASARVSDPVHPRATNPAGARAADSETRTITSTAHGIPRRMEFKEFAGNVVDEDGKSVKDAQIHVFPTNQHEPLAFCTNSEGFYSFKVPYSYYRIQGYDRIQGYVYVIKKGYYHARLSFPLYEPYGMGTKVASAESVIQLEKAVLRPVKNPRPMIVCEKVFHIPVSGQPCGYDLVKGSWVAPWGIGEVSDFIFTAYDDEFLWEKQPIFVKLTFSNSLDGIQKANCQSPSFFRWDYEAPLEDYKPEYIIHDLLWGRLAEGYFRIRTKGDEKKVTRGLYGRIRIMSVERGEKGECLVRFKYFLNPNELDRNMESDPLKEISPGSKRKLR